MSNRSLKILFYPIDGVGHQNGCIGMAQALAKRGHKIIFFSNVMFAGKYKKFGFDEIILDSELKKRTMVMKSEDAEHPLQAANNIMTVLQDMGFLVDATPYEKLDLMSKNMFSDMIKELIDIDPQMAKEIEREQPDLIFVDHMMFIPCIEKSNVPWISLCSASPLFLLNSPDFPPAASGLPSNDRTGWEEFRKKSMDTFKRVTIEEQNRLNKHFGLPEIALEDYEVYRSPYLTVYGYPKELDWFTDENRPEHLIQVDSFCRESSESFEIPEEFKAKIKPGEKLVYLSLGSMGSMDIELMRRVVGALAKSPHKFIVSKGTRHEEIELPDNMWGEAFLPQIKVLPLVDLVITHGGNNTVTETMSNGKPMLVMPFFADQFDNAQRVTEKGYGDRFPTAYRFQDDELVKKVDQLLANTEIQERCRLAGERIRSANSKEKACEKIEQFLTNHCRK